MLYSLTLKQKSTDRFVSVIDTLEADVASLTDRPGSLTGMVGLASKWVRLAPNGTIRGFFRSDFSAFGAPRQMH